MRVYVDCPQITVNTSTFTGSEVYADGGAMELVESRGLIKDCIFQQNHLHGQAAKQHQLSPSGGVGRGLHHCCLVLDHSRTSPHRPQSLLL
jgi:hypothetical protein